MFGLLSNEKKNYEYRDKIKSYYDNDNPSKQTTTMCLNKVSIK